MPLPISPPMMRRILIATAYLLVVAALGMLGYYYSIPPWLFSRAPDETAFLDAHWGNVLP